MNIYTFLKTRPLSWSAISSFEYDPEQWYETYILGKRQTSPEMTFGSMVDKKIQDDPGFLPDLPRYEHMQYKLEATFDGIPLIGVPDGLELTKSKKLYDYKTGRNAWSRKRANDTGQLTFYLLLINAVHGYRPEDFECGIWHLETTRTPSGEIVFIENMKPKCYKTKRTMVDVLEFYSRIKDTVKAMQEYVDKRQLTLDKLAVKLSKGRTLSVYTNKQNAKK